jgi:hypothetical protein
VDKSSRLSRLIFLAKSAWMQLGGTEKINAHTRRIVGSIRLGVSGVLSKPTQGNERGSTPHHLGTPWRMPGHAMHATPAMFPEATLHF